MLKGQLQPHFLFNTLNNLYSLVLKKSPEAPQVVLKLSELLHYVLADSSKTRIPLTHELALLKNYIALEQVRFGERLDLTMNIEGEFEKKTLPPLILLPFVENAFKHGANEMLDQPWVSFSLHVRGRQLKFKLINGKPAGQHIRGPLSTGIGLQNARRRLDMLYRDRYTLRTSDEGESFTVNLQLELEEV